MSSSRKSSPARSQEPPVTPNRLRPRASRSVGSPARSASGRLSNIVDKFKESYRDSFKVSPLNKTVTSDNTAIEMPRRRSWWRKVENSREMIEVPEQEEPVNPADVFEDFSMVVLSQEKNVSVDLPESSGSESIHSIVVPQRKLFIQKENQPQKDFDAIASTSEATKANLDDQTMHVATKKLFSQTTKRTKPVFPSALLNMTNDNTLANKTKELPVEIKAQPKGLFGNRPANKRKNMFADLVVSESEDEIQDVERRRFTFNKPSEPTRRSSNASSITTDIELDDWKLLPSSTMVEHQLEAQLTTPGKKAKLSKISKAKNSTNAEIERKLYVDEEREQILHVFNKGNHDNSKQCELEPQQTTPGKSARFSRLSEYKESSNSEIEQKLDEEKEQSEHAIHKQSHDNSNKNQLQDQLTTPVEKASPNKISQANECNKVDPEQKLNADKERETIEHEENKCRDKIEEYQQEAQLITLGKKASLGKLSEAKKSSIDEAEQKLDEVEEREQSEHTFNKEDHNKSKKHQIEDELMTTPGKRARLSKVSEVTEFTRSEGKQDLNEDEEKEQCKFAENEKDGDMEVESNVDMDDQEQEVSRKIEQHDDEQSDKEKGIQATVNEIPNQSYKLSETKKSTNTQVKQTIEVTEEKEQENELHLVYEEDRDENKNKSNENIDAQDHEISQKIEGQQNAKQCNVEDIEAEKEINGKNDENKYLSQELHEEDLNENIEDEEVQNKTQDQDEEQNEDHGNEDDEQEENLKNIEDDEQEESQEVAEDVELEASEEVAEENDEQEVSHEMDLAEEDDEHEESQELVEEDEQELTQEMAEEDDEQEENEEVAEEDEEQHESQEMVEEDKERELSQEMAEEDENVAEEDEEQDDSQEAVEDNEQSNSEEMEEEIIEASEEVEDQSSVPTDTNVTHDTTGRNRKKRETNTPEAILNDTTNELDSFTAKGRNTSIRKTIPKYFTLRQSMASARDSIGLSDGTKNSSADGSGWDSHRTTRKTLRQTFGKDFTPRKSLRALVMEKSAKRQTMINEANAELRRHQANSTELPDDHDDMDYEDNVESDHEISRRMRQANLDIYIQNFKKETMEMKQKIAEEIRNPIRLDILNRPNKLSICRANKTSQSAPKTAKNKRFKPLARSLENLPPELVEDMKYRPPKKFKPSNASWITKRLYKFLESKLEPKYDYKARIRAEKLVEMVYNFTREIRRLKVAPPPAVAELKRELARLDVLDTHHEFYDFVREYLPYEVRIKVIPDIINKIPVPRDVFDSIIPK